MDLVIHVRDLSTRDASGQLVESLVRVEFDGGGSVEIARDAAALLDWLDQQSTHLPPPEIP
jgi:hypothetical protein